MACRFEKVLEEEIEEAFYLSDLVNTKTTIPLRVSEIIMVDIYLDALRLVIYVPLFTSSSSRFSVYDLGRVQSLSPIQAFLTTTCKVLITARIMH